MFKNYLIGLPLLFAGLLNFLGLEDDYDRNMIVMNRIIDTSVKQLNKRYGLHACGRGSGELDNKSRMESVSFTINRKLNKEEARILMIEIVELFLHNINNTKNIESVLYDNPFTYKNLKFVVFIHNKDDSMNFHPDLGIVSLTGIGTVNFISYAPGNNYQYETDIEEPYEEAYKIATGKDYPEAFKPPREQQTQPAFSPQPTTPFTHMDSPMNRISGNKTLLASVFLSRE